MYFVVVVLLCFFQPKNTHINFFLISPQRSYNAYSLELPIMKTHLFKFIENFTIKNWKFSDKNSDIFHISAQKISCGSLLEPPCQGGSKEYPQSMFLSRKNNVYPCKPQFYCIKVGLKGSKYFRYAFMMLSMVIPGHKQNMFSWDI